MAEYINIPVQTIQANQNALFNDSTSPCNKGLVLHRNGSGQFKLRGCTANCRAKYRVDVSGNIAIAAGGTVEPISIAIAIDGEPDQSTTMIVTPAATGDFFNVSSGTDVWVPKGCCVDVGIENTSTQAIDASNLNITINRIG